VRKHSVSFALVFGALMLLRVPAAAAPIAACNSTFTECVIPENIMLQLPFAAISGDAIVLEPNSTTVSDVFRIFNNLVNTGFGTGLGNLVFLYSVDDGPLPAPSTYSANAVFLPENPSGFTSYVGNGTTYLLSAPEPRTSGLIGLACAALAILLSRARRAEGGFLCRRHS
jgi:hypothetical protein